MCKYSPELIALIAEHHAQQEHEIDMNKSIDFMDRLISLYGKITRECPTCTDASCMCSKASWRNSGTKKFCDDTINFVDEMNTKIKDYV